MTTQGVVLNSPNELSMCKELKIVQLNCCSLINKIDKFRHVLMSDLTIHVLYITETCFKPHHSSDLFAIKDYRLIRLDRTRILTNGQMVHGEGVACYIWNDITVEQLDMNISTVDLEMLTLNFLIQDRRKIFLYIVYCPPSGNYSVAINKLIDVINQIRETRSRHSLIISGDFNIDVSSTKLTPMLRSFYNLCREHALHCHTDTPTCYSFTGRSTTIDLFLTDSQIISQHGSINYNISDHLPVYIVLKKSKESYTRTTFRGRSYSNYDKNLFQSRLFYTNWGRLFAMTDINCAWDFFYNILLTQVNIMCPVFDLHFIDYVMKHGVVL